MKKITITLLVSGLLFSAGLKAQTLQEGINHLNADRFKSAVAVFEKLLATNPNNIDATYWLGQTYFDMDDNASARKLYDKALTANGNAPLLLVGAGHADLLENKTAEARQRFDAALLASRGKKGDDPNVLTAIGRANVDAKAGDFMYAIEKLEAAVARDGNNPETLMQLGNAYRKARPGEGGGKAFENYKRALEVKPDFAVADIRLAKLFESQKNWELVLQYLNDAIARDPKFAPAYYELFYYYFFREKYPEAEEQLKKYVAVADDLVANDYLYAQLCYGHKDYDCAITKAQSVASTMGAATKPKVFKLLSYSYFDKGDLTTAQKYLNDYFAKEKPDQVIGKDYELQASISLKTNGNIDTFKSAIIKGVSLDTVMTSKIETLKKYADTLKSRGDSLSRLAEGDLRMEVIKLKPTPSQRDYFDAGLAYYQGKNYTKSDSLFTIYTQKWPDETFGWQWKFNNQRAQDTSMALGLAVPHALKYLEVLEKDTAKNKSGILQVAGYLAQYYANIAKEKDKALEYLQKMLALDPTNADIQKYIDAMKKPAKPAKSGGTNPGPTSKPELPKVKNHATVRK